MLSLRDAEATVVRQSVVIEVDDDLVRVRTPASNLPVTFAGAGFVVLGVAMVASAVWSTVILGTVSLVVGVWMFVTSRRAAVLLDRSNRVLVERGDLRRRSISMSDIDQLVVGPSPHAVPWVCLWVRKRSGEAVPLEQVRLLGFPDGASHERLLPAASALNRQLTR